jgi:hypothetical protein
MLLAISSLESTRRSRLDFLLPLLGQIVAFLLIDFPAGGWTLCDCIDPRHRGAVVVGGALPLVGGACAGTCFGGGITCFGGVETGVDFG